MSKAEDINTLYKRFGGNAGTYQEIGASELAGAATLRWPLLGELRPQEHREAPAATRGGVAVGDRQVRNFMVPPVQRSAPVDPPIEQPAAVAQAKPAQPQTSSAPESMQTESVAPLFRKPEKTRHVDPVQQIAPEPEPPVVPPSPRALFGRMRDAESTRPQPAPVASSRVPVEAESVAKSASRPKKVKETIAEPVASSVPVPIKKTATKKATAKTKKRDAEPEDGSSLQAVFNRLVPPKPEAPAIAPAAAPLKKLVKW